jgi:hypothetical protein
MDPHHEKRTKNKQYVARTSMQGRSGRASVSRGPHPPPHPCHHPSHSSDEGEDDCEMLERHAPNERSSHMVI